MQNSDFVEIDTTGEKCFIVVRSTEQKLIFRFKRDVFKANRVWESMRDVSAQISWL
jgi:hypothetical protein